MNSLNDDDNKKTENIDSEEELFEKLEEIISSDKHSTHYIISSKAMPLNMIRTFKNIWIDFLYQLFLSMILIISLCGWFNVIKVNHFYELLIISGTFGILDYWLKTLVFKIKPILYLKTAGLIFALISTIIMSIVCVLAYFIFKVDFNSAWILVTNHLALLIIRFLLTTYIKKIKK